MKAKDQTAPGALDALRLLVNTEDVEKPDSDQLSSRQAATAWLQAHGLLSEFDALDDEDVLAVRELRGVLRMELLAHTGESGRDDTWGSLSAWADRAELGIRCGDRPEDITLVAEGRGAQMVIGRCFVLIYDAIRERRWERLKACRKETCLWAFYDHSKNGSGHWCDMAICGNRAKAQRRRRRQTLGATLSAPARS